MKFRYCFLLLLLSVMMNTMAQFTAEPLITITFPGITRYGALKKIETEYGVFFSFKGSMIRNEEKIYKSFNQIALTDVLKELFNMITG